jgi:hypothetical protein
MKYLTAIKDIVEEAFGFHASSPTALFKLFISTVLIQFAVLSLVSISTNGAVKDIPNLEAVWYSSHFWWGLLGLFGACSLVFERYIKGSLSVLVTGYLSAIASLALLSYDFITTKPPVHTGGILAATAVVFLGGILYGRIKAR